MSVLVHSPDLTMPCSHSVDTFNSLLIKRIRIPFVSNLPLQSLPLPFLQFYVPLIVNLQIGHWITQTSTVHPDCVKHGRVVRLITLHSSSLAHSQLSSDIILKRRWQQHSKSRYDQNGCGLQVQFPAGKIRLEEVNESHSRCISDCLELLESCQCEGL